MDQAAKTMLESLIDAHTLPVVLDALEEIAQEKADHVRTNWQDEPLARAWERVASALTACSTKIGSLIP